MENWKQQIRRQVTDATKQHCIGSNLKELVKTLLDGDTIFIMVYSSGRGLYTRVKFTEDKIGRETTKLILKKYGKQVYNYLKI